MRVMETNMKAQSDGDQHVRIQKRNQRILLFLSRKIFLLTVLTQTGRQHTHTKYVLRNVKREDYCTKLWEYNNTIQSDGCTTQRGEGATQNSDGATQNNEGAKHSNEGATYSDVSTTQSDGV